MAQQIVTIRIQEAADGTKSITLDPDDITLTDGDSLLFQATGDTPLTDGTPQIVFANAPASLADTKIDLSALANEIDLNLGDEPHPPEIALESGSAEGLVIDENIPAGDYDYSVQIAGAVLAAGRIKIIRQQ